ncbi:DUF5688 family protein [Acetatifactor muris]|nr:DUF5688 family protein [Acetatifactor muris]
MEVFAGKICAAVEKELGREFQAEIREVRKNNGILLHGLLISSEGQAVVPTIYLERFLEAHESGMTFEEVVRRVLSVYERSNPKGCADMDFFKSFGNVRDRICYRLIGRRGNEGLLEEIPYVEFLDLAICFYYAYHGEELGDGTILIYNSHMEMWGTCTEELLELAKRNTQKLFPWVCCSMEEVINEVMGTDGTEDGLDEGLFQQEVPMKVLSNRQRVHGAVCMVYPDVLEDIARKEGRDLYILPSSIHEVIILPYTGNEPASALKTMIEEVNTTQVDPQEVLSYSLYYYSRDTHSVMQV